MKWIRPNNGETRIRVKFLWLPKRIGKITRWLEFAEWEEQYRDTFDGWQWRAEKWITAPGNEE